MRDLHPQSAAHPLTPMPIAVTSVNFEQHGEVTPALPSCNVGTVMKSSDVGLCNFQEE